MRERCIKPVLARLPLVPALVLIYMWDGKFEA